MKLRPWLLGASLLSALAVVSGCSSAEPGEEEVDEGALEDSGKIVATTQTDLLLFQGYNPLFDQGHGSCAQFKTVKPQIGERGVDVKVSLVQSREDLAKQLGFDTDLSFKLPKAGADARAQVMNSFKRNSTTTTLLVRVGNYYSIDASQAYELTADAASLLQRDPRGFLQRCGEAVVTKLQYRAEIIGLMRFDTADQEKTTKAAGGAGVDVPAVGTIADANAKVGGTYEKMTAATKSTMSLELVAQGFVPGGGIPVENLQGPEAMKRLNDLLKAMAVSVERDIQEDTANLEKGIYPFQTSATPPSGSRPVIKRNARLSGLSFHAYAKNQSASMAAVANLTQGARAFLTEVGDVGGRMENAYYEEVNAFLTAKDQELYNLTSKPTDQVSKLEPLSQEFAGKLNPARADSVAGKLKNAQLECVRKAISGDYNGCKKTDDISKAIEEGKKQLTDYNNRGRVVRMNVVYGSSTPVTVDVARAACTTNGGRLPTDQEVAQWLKPALPKSGPVWVTTDKANCDKRIGMYSGTDKPECYSGWFMDWYDSALDATGLSERKAQVLCVGGVGPRPALAPPGE